jgi:hypothetical protein
MRVDANTAVFKQKLGSPDFADGLAFDERSLSRRLVPWLPSPPAQILSKAFVDLQTRPARTV